MNIGFSTTGEGPVRVIVLHGWLSDTGVFDQVVPFFDASKYSLARMDFRGYGASAGLQGDYSIEEIAKDALSVADELGWDTFHVMGHSMGGMAVQKMALLAPSRVLSGVAISPVPASGFEMDTDTAAFFQSSADDDAALAEIFNILTGKRHAAPFLNILVKRARAATTKAAYLGYLDAWTNTDFSADVATVKTPILVVAGACDGALGPDHMRATYLAQLANARLEVIDAAGHYPMLETPPELFTKVDAFLTEHGG